MSGSAALAKLGNSREVSKMDFSGFSPHARMSSCWISLASHAERVSASALRRELPVELIAARMRGTTNATTPMAITTSIRVMPLAGLSVIGGAVGLH